MTLWHGADEPFSAGTPARAIFATTTARATTISSSSSAPASLTNGANVHHRAGPDFTAILMLLIRLTSHATDIVVTINVPHMPGEYDPAMTNVTAGRVGPLISTAVEYRDTIINTFEIKDYGLFITD
jgi:hypothetical protein